MRIGFFATLLIGIVCASGCTKHRAQTVIFNQPVTVAGDWVTVKLPQPLVATAQWEQELLATVSSRYEESTQGQFGMKMPDGSVIWPEVQVENDEGVWLPLTGRGFYGRDLSFTDRTFSGDGKRYVSVRLRSPKAITVAQLVWNSYDPREVKR